MTTFSLTNNQYTSTGDLVTKRLLVNWRTSKKKVYYLMPHKMYAHNEVFADKSLKK